MSGHTFLLRSSPRWHTLEPADPPVPHTHVLYIDRTSLSVSLRDRIECAALAEPDSESIVFGLAGLIEGLYDSYILLVTKRRATGKLLEHTVYRVDKLTALPVRGKKMLKKMASALGIGKKELAEEAMLGGMVSAAVGLPGFYYAHGLDLTRSAQKRADRIVTGGEGGEGSVEPEFAKADMRFVWNRYAARRLLEIGAVSWVVPLILGFVEVKEGMVNGKSVTLAIVSRREADRPGLRFTARGADVHGNCSNFVETEQIVTHGASYSSYVQVRGSIPLLWKQEACIKYKPKPTLKQVDAGGKGGLGQKAFEKHFDALFEQYGPVTAISLIDNRGGEATLHAALRSAVDLMANSKLHFVPWDFHKMCKGMKYEKVDHDLIPSIDEDLNVYSYFYTKDGTSAGITKRQRGVVRTNCIDSLDRTNVVQSVIAHRMMDAALKVMGVLDSNPETFTAAKFADFEKAFKNAWADNANALSQVYAGSGALKTDYTRTGKRSKAGMMQDGVRAARRYVYQNFLDGQRQDGIDIFLGVVSVPRGQAGSKDLSSIKSKAEPLMVKEKYLPHLFVLFLLIAVMGVMLNLSTKMKMGMVVVGVAGAALSCKLILGAGHKLVARPKLDGTN